METIKNKKGNEYDIITDTKKIDILKQENKEIGSVTYAYPTHINIFKFYEEQIDGDLYYFQDDLKLCFNLTRYDKEIKSKIIDLIRRELL
jgi:CO dehydrogenase/acetyl-CoA synthase alpha subunit